MAVEQNKVVAERFFEGVFNNKKVELVDELVTGDVTVHNRIIFAQRIRRCERGHPDAHRCLSRLVRRRRTACRRGRLPRAESQDGGNQHAPITRAWPSPRATPSGKRWGPVPDGKRQDCRTVGHVQPDGHAHQAGHTPSHRVVRRPPALLPSSRAKAAELLRPFPRNAPAPSAPGARQWDEVLGLYSTHSDPSIVSSVAHLLPAPLGPLLLGARP